ncbi:unnamed protein product [Urochloa decumbens]|uniref:Uncharacterized protein n=1 Tax=Urochloa decumbens TaxID=240449 RepID=A0ABC9H1F9_9POAL
MAFDSSFQDLEEGDDAKTVMPLEIVKFEGMSIDTSTKSGPLNTEPKAARDGSNATLRNRLDSIIREYDELHRSSEHIEELRLQALIDKLKDLSCEANDVLASIRRDARKMLSRIEAGETISQDEFVVFLKNIVAAAEGKKRGASASEALPEPKKKR